jgi:hypothetical protein
MLADNEESEFVELEKAKASKKKQIKHKAQVTKKDKTLAKDIQEDEDDFDTGEIDDDLVELEEEVKPK